MAFSRLIALTLTALVAAPPAATPADDALQTAVAANVAVVPAAPEPDLDALLWVARPLVVFADTESDPRFGQQMTMLAEGKVELENLRVVVLVDTDPAANGPLRQTLRPNGFGLVLIDTDGVVVQRRPVPTTVRELAGTIDRLQSRRLETGSRRR